MHPHSETFEVSKPAPQCGKSLVEFILGDREFPPLGFLEDQATSDEFLHRKVFQLLGFRVLARLLLKPAYSQRIGQETLQIGSGHRISVYSGDHLRLFSPSLSGT
jgi:hypothetical protein